MAQQDDRFLFNFMNDPSIIDGNTEYQNIVVKNKLKEKYAKYVQKNKTIPFRIYFDKEKEIYLYHFQLKSDSDPKVIYDVAIEFTSKDLATQNEESLVHYDAKFFSNTPGFSFKYAYVYNKRGILIPRLTNRFDGVVLEEAPKKTNPRLAVGFDYALFFCMWFLYTNSWLLQKKEVFLKGKPLEKFIPLEVPTCYEVLDKRSAKELGLVEKITGETIRTIKSVSKPIRNKAGQVIGSVKSGASSIVKKVKKITPISATNKLVRVIKPKKKR